MIKIDARDHGLGWLPDYPDFRDYSTQTGEVKQLLKNVGVGNAAKVAAPSAIDLRHEFPPIENQESIGSCTANAGVAVVEYFEKRAFGRFTDASRLFLYKATRNLLGWTGDTGAYLRTTMGALVLFGVPPERYWPYRIADYDVEPSAFCYSFARNYQAINYYRLDPPGTARDVLLQRIKANLAAHMPSMFGFTVYSSISQATGDGKIPFPAPNESSVGGHAIVAAGYDDDMEIINSSPNGPTTTGALLIRNSWGTAWGDAGYGWLPYDYVTRWQAVDWWSLVKNEWIDTGQFSL